MRIRPTALGCKGLLLLAALECAFLATSYSNLFFLLITFSVVTGVLALAWTASNLRGLQIVRIDLPMAAAGCARDVNCQLRSARSRYDLRLELVLPDAAAPIAHAARIAGTTAVAGALAPQARGIRAARAVRVTSHFPLGLFAAHVDLPIDAQVVSHPAPLDASAALAAGGADGDGRAPVARGVTVQELRAFRTGDSFGDVHWKATARRGQPVVKEREREGDRSLAFVIDRRCTAEALDQALALVAGAVLTQRRNAAVIRIVSQDVDLRFERSRARAGADTILRWLAAAATLPADAPPPPAAAAGALRLPVRSPAEVRS